MIDYDTAEAAAIADMRDRITYAMDAAAFRLCADAGMNIEVQAWIISLLRARTCTLIPSQALRGFLALFPGNAQTDFLHVVVEDVCQVMSNLVG